MKKTACLVLLGTAAGALNGFLGTGGGTLIILMLAYMRKKGLLNGCENDEGSLKTGSRKTDYSTAVAAIMPMSLVSLFSYWKGGSLDFERAGIYLFPAALGGLLGAFLLEKIRLDALKRLFGWLMLISGAIIVWRAF